MDHSIKLMAQSPTEKSETKLESESVWKRIEPYVKKLIEQIQQIQPIYTKALGINIEQYVNNFTGEIRENVKRLQCEEDVTKYIAATKGITVMMAAINRVFQTTKF